MRLNPQCHKMDAFTTSSLFRDGSIRPTYRDCDTHAFNA
jgi:hypothetical protein